MPSSYSPRLRLNYQAPGDNLNTWGLVLNNGVFQLLEDAIARRVDLAVSGERPLGTANGAADDSRCAFIDVTGGSGGTITIPATEKLYVVRNGASGDVSVTTGAGLAATLKPGEVIWIVSDAANVRRVQATDMMGGRLSGVGVPVHAGDAVNKGYADALAFNTVNLPGQGVGTAGAFVKSNGTSAAWASLTTADLADYGADQISRQTAQEDFAVVMALIL